MRKASMKGGGGSIRRNNMGTQFWWFYDAIAAAVVLICIFVSGKKGSMKGTYTLVACLLSAIISFGLSNSISKVLYEASMKTSCTKKLNDHIEEETFISAYKDFLESQGYSINVKYEKLEAIFLSEQKDYTDSLIEYVNNINGKKVEADEEVLRDKMYEGYSDVVRTLVARSLNNKYVTETAARLSLSDRKNIQKMVPLITDPNDQHAGAVFIADNYVAKAYQTLFRLISFELFFVILTLLIGVTITSMIGSRRDNTVTVRSHIGGGLVGIFTGAIFIFAAAVMVRLCAVMGSDEMLFFNHSAVEQSYVFKYFYNIIMKL